MTNTELTSTEFNQLLLQIKEKSLTDPFGAMREIDSIVQPMLQNFSKAIEDIEKWEKDNPTKKLRLF